MTARAVLRHVCHCATILGGLGRPRSGLAALLLEQQGFHRAFTAKRDPAGNPRPCSSTGPAEHRPTAASLALGACGTDPLRRGRRRAHCGRQPPPAAPRVPAPVPSRPPRSIRRRRGRARARAEAAAPGRRGGRRGAAAGAGPCPPWRSGAERPGRGGKGRPGRGLPAAATPRSPPRLGGLPFSWPLGRGRVGSPSSLEGVGGRCNGSLVGNCHHVNRSSPTLVLGNGLRAFSGLWLNTNAATQLEVKCSL